MGRSNTHNSEMLRQINCWIHVCLPSQELRLVTGAWNNTGIHKKALDHTTMITMITLEVVFCSPSLISEETVVFWSGLLENLKYSPRSDSHHPLIWILWYVWIYHLVTYQSAMFNKIMFRVTYSKSSLTCFFLPPYLILSNCASHLIYTCIYLPF